MALDLQAILNEAVSEVLEKKGEETKDSVTEPVGEVDDSAAKKVGNDVPSTTPKPSEMPKEIKGDDESKEDLKEKVVGAVKKGYESVKSAAEEHPYAAAATGALAAGAGALGLRKMIKKRGGLKK